MSSNEGLIRVACKRFFKKKHSSAVIQDEFTQWNINVRPDLFIATSSKLISVEIKSDKDSFARMERQLLGYDHFSSEVYVALDHKHVKSFINKYGMNQKFYNVGVLSYKKGKLKLVKEAGTKDVPMLYEMLWSQ